MGKLLYLGLNPDDFSYGSFDIHHFPIIEVCPLYPPSFPEATHLIVTSQTTAALLELYIEYVQKKRLKVLAVGEATAQKLGDLGYQNIQVAPVAQGEGIVELLKKCSCKDRFLYPRSKLARPLIEEALKKLGAFYHAVDLYTVIPTRAPLPDISQFELFYFTSRSTVEAFIELFGQLPPMERCLAIGPLTQAAFQSSTQLLKP
jgi:uroporphyrinogen-III synthase